jgi:hypothetical protein
MMSKRKVFRGLFVLSTACVGCVVIIAESPCGIC